MNYEVGDRVCIAYSNEEPVMTVVEIFEDCKDQSVRIVYSNSKKDLEFHVFPSSALQRIS